MPNAFNTHDNVMKFERIKLIKVCKIILNFFLFVGHLVVDYLLHSGNATTFNAAIDSDSYLPYNLVLVER